MNNLSKRGENEPPGILSHFHNMYMHATNKYILLNIPPTLAFLNAHSKTKYQIKRYAVKLLFHQRRHQIKSVRRLFIGMCFVTRFRLPAQLTKC